MRILDLIGGTPLLRLQRLAPSPEVEVYAKAEWTNPGGSVKDRAALSMIRAGEAGGQLTPGKTILDATSGNTGVAYALIGAALGYKVTLCLPQNASRHRQRMLKVLGAELILTDPMASTDGAIREARRLVAEHPERYYYPDQYSNDANWQAHYHTTAPEIFEQTQGRITHFVCGLGTSGTFMGTGRRLRQLKSDVHLISMQPDLAFHGLEGMKHMETAMVPAIYDPSLADDNLEVSTEEAHVMARRLAREEGWFVGVSGAANVVAALRVAELLQQGVVVTIIPDDGSKYLADSFWEVP